MSGHGYETGRLNLPFVGLCSFGKYPYQPDWSSIDADFAILGAPFDLVLNSGLVQDLVPVVSAKHQLYFRSAMQVLMTMKMMSPILRPIKFALLILVTPISFIRIPSKAMLILRWGFVR